MARLRAEGAGKRLMAIWLALAAFASHEAYCQQSDIRFNASVPSAAEDRPENFMRAATSPLPAVAVQDQRAFPDATPIALPPSAGGKPFPINLPTAFRLGNADALDIALASRRLQAAAAQLEGSSVLWLPSLLAGTDYYRHDGQIQDVVGNVFPTGKQGFMVGGNPYAIFSVSDAIFAPLASRQNVAGRQQAVRAATNDVMLGIAESYFTIQQARGELIGALDAVARNEELLRRVEKLAPSLVPVLEVSRARTELARRRQLIFVAQNRWRASSADLIRVLNIDPRLIVNPIEPPDLRLKLIELDKSVDEFIPLAIATRPELAAQQAFVQATVERLRQERVRPLVPNIMVRGFSTPASGTLAAGLFGGGVNGSMSNFGLRQDWDVQAIWQVQNLGFGTKAIIRERAADNQAASVEAARIRNLIAAEVVQAYASVQTAADRTQQAEVELKEARDTVEQNLIGLGQTRRAGDLNILVVRPQEAVAAVQQLSQAYTDYFGAIADFNRAQFRLYRALGQPARRLLDSTSAATPMQPEPLPPPT